MRTPHRWFLGGARAGDGHELDSRVFLKAHGLTVGLPLTIAMRQNGEPLDFTLADFDMPVVRPHVGAAIARAAGSQVQLLEARVQGHAEAFVVLNVLQAIDCLDRNLSEFDVWTSSDGEADLVGRLKTVYKLRVRPSAAAGAAIFRIAGWETALIVSADIMTQLATSSGVAFDPV